MAWEETGARPHYRHYAGQCTDDDLTAWHADMSYLLAVCDAGEMDGERADNRQLINWQLDAIAAERALRERIKIGRAEPAHIYPRDVLDEIRRRINLVHILENRGATLHKAGQTWRGACLFCRSDNATTLTIWRSADGGEHFRCWRCAARGDVFTAVQALDRCGFREAVTGLAAVAGVDVAPPSDAPPSLVETPIGFLLYPRKGPR